MPLYALDGHEPDIHPTAWVAPTAVLIGRVRLLKNASVWWGAVLRGDNDWLTIGENSNIQDNSVLHCDEGQPLTIGANCTIGHNVVIHCESVGDNTLIGMSAILLNRARIGKNSIVGANSLVSEGKQFEDGVMILGTPGRVVRHLSEEEVNRLPGGAVHYVENQRRFAGKLKRID